MRIISAIGLLCLFNLNTRAHAQSQTKGLDVNDVAVLFPLDSNNRPVPFIRLDKAGSQGNLLSKGILADLTTQATEQWISAPMNTGIFARENWAVVGFRYDPCAPSDDIASTTCIQELRLVAQPQSQNGPADSAIHLVYKLGEGLPSPSDPVLADLLNLKRQAESLTNLSTSGQPLGVHPVLLAAVNQNRPDISVLFQTFILTHATNQKLHKLTMMGLRDGSPNDWIFLGGDVQHGRWKQTDIPNLGSGTKSGVELNLQGNPEVFSPLTANSSLSTEDFFNSNPAGVQNNFDKINRAVHSLENPALSNRNTVDCLSCHTATSVRLDNNFHFANQIAGLTPSIPQRITAFPAPGILGAHPRHWNLRAFGYFANQATVSMRTVNEAGEAAATLNTMLKLTAPGKDCSAVSPSVMSCFVNTSKLFGKGATADTCLKTCTP
ncbi:MAG: hypothetical protein H7249_17700 [Chitinophagaceae bacterium]|nr:hypothetical protein [Oligoflexus sp.]